MSGSLSTLVERARAEFEGCIRFVQDGPASSTDDLEAHVSAFLGVAQQLQQGFEQAQQRSTMESADLLREDVEALRREQLEKGKLIARHRERLLKWSAELRDIEAAQQAQLTLSADAAPGVRPETRLAV